MRTCWEALHASLVHSVDTLEAHHNFNEARRRWPELETYPYPAALVDYFTDADGDPDRKDRIYTGLVEIVQARGEGETLGTALLFLGLWPALDRIFRRSQCHHLEDPSELVSNIWDHFTSTVHHADLKRIQRVAATLTRNTERDLHDSRQRTWDEGARLENLQDGEQPLDVETSTGRWGISDLGVLPWMEPDEEIERLRQGIAEIVGDDADLVIGATIYGITQHEMAEQLGIKHATARKRFQRAIKRLRTHFEKK